MKATKLILAAGILMLLLSEPLRAQVASTLAGTVTNQSGAAVSNAKVSVNLKRRVSVEEVVGNARRSGETPFTARSEYAAARAFLSDCSLMSVP